MAKFKVGDRVQVPKGTDEVPPDRIGEQGEVKFLIWGTAPNDGPFEWEMQYGVQFDSEEFYFGMREQWLAPA